LWLDDAHPWRKGSYWLCREAANGVCLGRGFWGVEMPYLHQIWLGRVRAGSGTNTQVLLLCGTAAPGYLAFFSAACHFRWPVQICLCFCPCWTSARCGRQPQPPFPIPLDFLDSFMLGTTWKPRSTRLRTVYSAQTSDDVYRFSNRRASSPKNDFGPPRRPGSHLVANTDCLVCSWSALGFHRRKKKLCDTPEGPETREVGKCHGEGSSTSVSSVDARLGARG
jgi:hypothetical protein